MFKRRSACSGRGGIGLTAKHDLSGELELLAAKGIEHFGRRLSGFAISTALRTEPNL
jgi:hypothetical protein